MPQKGPTAQTQARGPVSWQLLASTTSLNLSLKQPQVTTGGTTVFGTWNICLITFHKFFFRCYLFRWSSRVVCPFGAVIISHPSFCLRPHHQITWLPWDVAKGYFQEYPGPYPEQNAQFHQPLLHGPRRQHELHWTFTKPCETSSKQSACWLLPSFPSARMQLLALGYPGGGLYACWGLAKGHLESSGSRKLILSFSSWWLGVSTVGCSSYGSAQDTSALASFFKAWDISIKSSVNVW